MAATLEGVEKKVKGADDADGVGETEGVCDREGVVDGVAPRVSDAVLLGVPVGDFVGDDVELRKMEHSIVTVALVPATLAIPPAGPVAYAEDVALE